MELYNVFKRRPWKKLGFGTRTWVPDGGARKTSVAKGVSLDEAKRICAEGNAGKDRSKPGQIYYEFERQ